MTAPDDYNQKQLDTHQISGAHLTKLAEFWQDSHFLKTDGYLGPATLKNILKDEMVDGISDADTDPTRQLWEAFDGPLESLPRGRRDVYRVFGNPGSAKVDRKWVKENIREFRNLPGVPPKWYVKLHKLAEPYVREALRRAGEVSDYRIERFGGFVFRHQQHKDAMPLSYHSFGIAFDVNPPDNSGKHYERGAAPEPFSEEWDLTWPNGMDKAFVDAIKSVGFGWGGDWNTFKDPMHFELVMR
jgi:hypothetical protein